MLRVKGAFGFIIIQTNIIKAVGSRLILIKKPLKSTENITEGMEIIIYLATSTITWLYMTNLLAAGSTVQRNHWIRFQRLVASIKNLKLQRTCCWKKLIRSRWPNIQIKLIYPAPRANTPGCFLIFWAELVFFMYNRKKNFLPKENNYEYNRMYWGKQNYFRRQTRR